MKIKRSIVIATLGVALGTALVVTQAAWTGGQSSRKTMGKETVITLSTLDPGEVTQRNGITHIRGMVAELIELGADLSGNPIPALTGRAVVSMNIDIDAKGGVVMDATAVKEVGTWTGDLTLGDSGNPPVFHPSGGGVWFGTVHSKGTLPPGNSTAQGILFGILGKVEGMQYRINGEAPTFGVAVYDVQLLDPHAQQ